MSGDRPRPDPAPGPGAESTPGVRRCGVLLHPTALPGTPACGSFGLEAERWIEALAAQGIQVWQLLPLAPTDSTGSPYSSPSAFALNPWLLDAEQLVRDGLLRAGDLQGLPEGRWDRLDLETAPQRAEALAARLASRQPSWSAAQQASFEAWRRAESHWLQDHCRFVVLKRLHGQQPWWQWPAPLAHRSRRALRALDGEQAAGLLQEALLQWQLQWQWQRLQGLARRLDVQLVGDVPFYVAHDSADVWSHRRLFSVRRDGSLVTQSGVPPDYFAATGQLWGTPVYSWLLHRLTGFRWWLRRLERQLQLVDLLRIDHFRALEAAWWVDGQASTAIEGRWHPSPGEALLRRLRRHLHRRAVGGADVPLIAEDLGVITPEVEALRDRHGLPGMKILQFAFDGNPDNAYLPANYQGSHWVVYTGTHDNATCIGWWNGLGEEERRRVEVCVGGPVHAPGWQLLELALASRAGLAVVPLQDLLHLGDAARFNTPGTSSGNWEWRLLGSVADLEGPLRGLGELARRYGR
ncbi:4-alpha-glucanotransferase [Vulcanococcus limneticus]|uniref:4-alpha-glucanotransferase n=1 Tax=Vulcanococcus limneticus TaxID=2170428 RepID=UPI000B9828D1|nr:4-alpha-glucanotransferase [Vulcanococcus limneticus]MCP9790688.1 4-alpha-glucanotransferase [Vulcanococcus limneticus MW73D5]MCP9892970.1 4-alpha-glucanotransferase [Vulcanococcus limneticus Candia 3F8]MCP9896295.1 4-alpha-glucanotransferase [Vulcanococcus limneticus Candia 3B3]